MSPAGRCGTPPRTLTACALLLLAPPALAEGPPAPATVGPDPTTFVAVANDPVSLDGPRPPAPVEPNATARPPAAAAAHDDDAAPPPAPAAAIAERAPLGAPPDTPRATLHGEQRLPAASGDNGADAPWWQRFDPRRNELTRVVGALAVVLGLVLLTRVVLRRASSVMNGAGRPSGVLDILARYPVARGQQLILLKLGRRLLLVHQNGSVMSTLSEVTGPEEVASLLARVEAGTRGRAALRFKSILRRHEAEFEAPAPPRRGRPSLGAGVTESIVDLTRGGAAGRRVNGQRRLA